MENSIGTGPPMGPPALKLTSNFTAIVVSPTTSPLNITWSGGDTSLITITLYKGGLSDLKSVTTIAGSSMSDIAEIHLS